MSENQNEVQSLNAAIEDGQLSEDIYWAFQVLSLVKDDDDIDRLSAQAPTPGAAVMLRYANDHRRDFFKDILPKALNRKGKDLGLRDDGRKRVEIFGEIYNRITEEFTAKRECPMCGRGLTKHTPLFRRPQKAR